MVCAVNFGYFGGVALRFKRIDKYMRRQPYDNTRFQQRYKALR